MRTVYSAVLVLAAIIGTSGCEINRDDAVEDLSVVATMFDEDVDFGQYVTFAVADSLGIIELGDDLDIDHSKDDLVFDSIRGNLLSRGYEEIDDLDTADFVILVGVTTREWSTTTGGCWGWGCWYYCYPYYCTPVTTVPAFTEGMLLIAAVDGDEFAPSAERIGMAWLAFQAGYVEGIAKINDVLNNIDQSFLQSPYFRRTEVAP